MWKHILVIITFLLFIQVVHAQPVNNNLSNGIIFDGEPFIAVNPTNSQNIVAAWMGMEFSGGQFRIAIKTRASFNGGESWSTVHSFPHFGQGYGSADPAMAFGKDGKLFACYIDYRQLPDSGGIYVSRSLDGGLTWDTPSKAFDMYDVPFKRPIDRPWLAVDNSATASAGTLYLTTKPAPWIAPPNRGYYKVSTDEGHTWSAIAPIDTGTHLTGDFIASPMPAPATTINGKFCAVYPSYVLTQNIYPAFYLATSTDKGVTLSYTTLLAAMTTPLDTNFKNGYQLVASVTDSNKMVFFLPNNDYGDEDIMALHTNDGGATWSARVRVNDDPVGNGIAQDMVWGAFNEEGKIVVTWRDRRNSGSSGFWNVGYDFYYATSTDNGETFSANKRLSSQFIAFDSVVAESGNDFMSSVFRGDTLYTVWGDTRNNRMNIYFSKTDVNTNTGISISLLDGEESAWNIFPNPAAGELNVVLNQDLVGKEVSVYDAAGRKVLKLVPDELKFKIDTKNLESGVYFIRVGGMVKRFSCVKGF